VVNQIDELQMSWEKSTDKIGTPLLKSLWQDSMVSV
jgi:hypothetical protein